MTVEFKKIPTSGINFEVSFGDVQLSGHAQKTDKAMIRVDGKMCGQTPHHCDRCAEVFTLLVNESVEVFASDGLYEDNGEELLNIVEFFDGSINFDTILQSELEALKSDYHYCGGCEQIQGV
jgi:uncharacterized metal-binding protein YceD (DUF177 family)